MEEDIRMRGILYHHQHRFGKKWKKVWAVVAADSVQSVARLELFDHRQLSMKEGHSGKRLETKRVILLRDCIRISEGGAADPPKDCASFLIETAEKLHVFAAQTSEIQSWVKELCRLAFPKNQSESWMSRQISVSPLLRDHTPLEMTENSLYETAASARDFLVIAVDTEAAERCRLFGEYILTPLRDRLLLKDHKTKELLFSWPYCFIRKFGQDRLSFSFEAGRRCQTGEGSFEFATNQGPRLFKIVSDAIKNLPPSETSGSKPKSPASQRGDSQNANGAANHVAAEGSAVPPQRPPKKLTSSFRSLSLDAIETPNKGQVRSINSCPPLTPNAPDVPNTPEPVYAMITKPQTQPNHPTTDKASHWQSVRDYLHTPLLVDMALFQEEEEGERCGRGESAEPLSPVLEDYDIEDVYAEPADCENGAPWGTTGVFQLPLEDAEDAEEDFFFMLPPPPPPPDPSDDQTEGFSTYDNLMLTGKKTLM